MTQKDYVTYTAYVSKATDYLKTGNYQGSIAELTQAIQLDPSEFHGYLSRGLCYLKTGDYQYAIDDFSKAIEIDPDNISAKSAYALRAEAQSKLNESKGFRPNTRKKKKTFFDL